MDPHLAAPARSANDVAVLRASNGPRARALGWLGAAIVAAATLATHRAAAAGRSEGFVSRVARVVVVRHPRARSWLHATRESRHHHGEHHHHARVNLRAYRENVRHWHDTANLAPPTYSPDGHLVLRLYSVNSREHAEVVAQREDGGFDDVQQSAFARVLGDARHAETHPIDPRLMDLLYQTAVHFRAPQLTVVSGFRAHSGRSNHAIGRAVDFLIPGVNDRDLSDYLQTISNVGVGSYPVSGFVHLDVRDYNTHWVDVSGPGQRPRYRGRHRHHHHSHQRTAHR